MYTVQLARHIVLRLFCRSLQQFVAVVWPAASWFLDYNCQCQGNCKFCLVSHSIFYVNLIRKLKWKYLARVIIPHCCNVGSVRQSVCLSSIRPSACLSHSWSTPKWFKISNAISPARWGVVSSFLRPNFVVASLGVHPKRGWEVPCGKTQSWPIICNNLDTVRDRM